MALSSEEQSGITGLLKKFGIDQSQLQSPNYGMMGSILGGLGTIVNGNRVADTYDASANDSQAQLDTLKGQMDAMPTLASMYGQDSPYALELKKTLAAKDAAAGRNSQYGPRAVQLQSMLADKGSQYAQQQAQMMNLYNKARTDLNTSRTNAAVGKSQVQGQQLGGLMNLADKTGLLNWANQGLQQGLSGMFGGGTGGETVNPYSSQPMEQSPYAGGGNYTGYTTGSTPEQGNYDNFNYDYSGSANYDMGQSPSNSELEQLWNFGDQ
jgi:hypothetical protein